MRFVPMYEQNCTFKRSIFNGNMYFNPVCRQLATFAASLRRSTIYRDEATYRFYDESLQRHTSGCLTSIDINNKNVQ